MKKILKSLLLGLLLRPRQGFNSFQRSTMDLAKLKMSLLYLKSIETSRLLFASLLGIGICLVLLMSSVFLFHASIFLYSSWSAAAKMWFGIFFAVLYMALAAAGFIYIFSQAKWLKIFHAGNIADDLNKKSSSEEIESGENGGKNRRTGSQTSRL